MEKDLSAALKICFKEREDIAFAFLFGSVFSRAMHKDSDVDVGVYFQSDARGLWREEDRYFPQEQELLSDLEKTTGKKVDLVVLNRAFPTVADSALRGEPLVIRDKKVWLNFVLRTTSEAIDLRSWLESFWQVKTSRRKYAAAG